MASADGEVDDAEQSLLVEQVHRVEGLTDAERARLDAHRLLLTSSEVSLDDVASRVVALPEKQRAGIGSYLLHVALVDGVVTDDERRTVRAVFDLLGLDPAEVDDRLGPLPAPTEAAEPAPAEPGELYTLQLRTPDEDDGASLFVLRPVTPGDTDLEDHTQPEESATASAREGLDDPERLVALDESRLRATQRSNHAVRDLLGAIFAEDEDDEPESPEPPATALATLDAAHSTLLSDLASRGTTTRPELERVAARCGVLPDGALDLINEAALDLTEEPVIEVHDDESVTVDSAIYEEMRA